MWPGGRSGGGGGGGGGERSQTTMRYLLCHTISRGRKNRISDEGRENCIASLRLLCQ